MQLVTDENLLSIIATALNEVFKGNIDTLGITRMEVLQENNQNMEVCIFLSHPGIVIGKRGSTIEQLTKLMTERTKLPVKITLREDIPWWRSLSCYMHEFSEQDLQELELEG